MKKKEDFFVTFGTNQHNLMRSKQILEDLFNITLRLRDSSFDDGLTYKYRFPGEGYAKISLYKNYMPEVDEWKAPRLKQYQVIISFIGLELDVSEIEALSKYFNYVEAEQI